MNMMERIIDTVNSFRSKSSSGRVTSEGLTSEEKKQLAELNKMTHLGMENMKKKYGATVDTEEAKKIAKSKEKKDTRGLEENIKQ